MILTVSCRARHDSVGSGSCLDELVQRPPVKPSLATSAKGTGALAPDAGAAAQAMRPALPLPDKRTAVACVRVCGCLRV
eukprot:2182264-Pleurochrysis_carterae.AAC.5